MFIIKIVKKPCVLIYIVLKYPQNLLEENNIWANRRKDYQKMQK